MQCAARFIPCLNEFPKIILQNLSHVSIKAIHDTKRSTISVNNIPNDIAHWGEIISILLISQRFHETFPQYLFNRKERRCFLLMCHEYGSKCNKGMLHMKGLCPIATNTLDYNRIWHRKRKRTSLAMQQ